MGLPPAPAHGPGSVVPFCPGCQVPGEETEEREAGGMCVQLGQVTQSRGRHPGTPGRHPARLSRRLWGPS